MKLLEYLNQNYDSNAAWTTPELVQHFIDTFGVNVKVVDNLYLFSYDTLAVKWSEVTFNCRGTILAYVDSHWIVISRPWDKFFNYHEGHSGVYQEQMFNEYVSKNSCYLSQKTDGTAMQFYWNPLVNQWGLSTLGTINTANCYDYPFTFAELFWKIVNAKYNNEFFTRLNQDYTWLFELCTKHNRIVTKYPDNTIFLIGGRHKLTGEYVPVEDVNEIGKALGCPVPEVIVLNEKLQNLQAVLELVEAEASNPAYGEFSEGFVLYNNGKPVCKLKNSNYLALHHLGGGDRGHARNCVIDAFFAGNIDDIFNVLDDDHQEFIGRLRQWYLEKVNVISDTVNKLSGEIITTQKDYALFVQKSGLPRPLLSLFFTFKEEILAGTFSHDSIAGWFKDKWRSFKKEVKAV